MMGWFIRLVGRRLAWRIGRKLYFDARGELRNEMHSNGEAWLIRAAVARLSRSGSLRAWDVGGNLGLWTDLLLEEAARSGVEARIDVFEPAAGAFATLTEKFGNHPLVEVHQIALSNRSGTAQFEVVGPAAGTNSLNLTHSADAELVEVVVAPGAEWHGRSAGGQIDLVKIDAEGHDLEVIRGLEPLLDSRQIGLIQFEYNWRWLVNGSSLRKLFELVERKDYRLGRLLADGLELYDSWNGELDRFFEGNYVVVRSDLVERFRHRLIGWCDGNLPVERPARREAT